MKKVLIAGGVGILALAGSIAFAAPAMATEAPNVTVVWSMPNWIDSTHASYAQTLVSQTPENTVTLDVAVPNTCGTQYQVDSYVNTPELQALLVTGKLTGPQGATDSSYLSPGSWGVAYKLVQNEACPPPTVAILPVTSTPATCDRAATYTVPVQPDGVKYALAVPTDPNSARPVPGTFTLADGVSLTINAHSISGYAPVSQSWTVVGAKATGVRQSTDASHPCYVAPAIIPTVKHDTPLKQAPMASLAYTGGNDVTTGLIPWGIAFALLGIGFVILKRRSDRLRA